MAKNTDFFGNRGGQAIFEHVMLIGFVLVAMIAILFFISHFRSQTPYMGDALGVLDNSVESLSGLGSGSVDTVVLRIPDGVENATFTDCDTGNCKAINISYSSGEEDIFEMDYFVAGSLDFFRVPGMHYITLYNDWNDEQIVFQECGDGIVTGGEQCEPCLFDEDCLTGFCVEEICSVNGGNNNYCGGVNAGGTGQGNFGCGEVGSNFGCFCLCDYNDDCLTGICNSGVCDSCNYDIDCPSGMFCVNGACRPPQCSDGIDNDYDGFIDYPNDPGCQSNSDTSEYDISFEGERFVILRIEYGSGGHAATYDYLDYPMMWKYEVEIDEGHVCLSDGSNVVVRANFDDYNNYGINGHLEKKDMNTLGYTDVCFSNSSFDCEYTSAVNSCNVTFGSGYRCVGTMDADTNSHAGECANPNYDIKVCCKH